MGLTDSLYGYRIEPRPNTNASHPHVVVSVKSGQEIAYYETWETAAKFIICKISKWVSEPVKTKGGDEKMETKDFLKFVRLEPTDNMTFTVRPVSTETVIPIVLPVPTDTPWGALKILVENNLAACDPKLGAWSKGAHNAWSQMQTIMEEIESKTDNETNKLLTNI